MSGHHFLLLKGHVLSLLLVNSDTEELLILVLLLVLGIAAVILLLAELLVQSLVHELLLEVIISVHLRHDVLCFLGAEVRFVVLAVHVALVRPLSASLIHLHCDELLIRTHILLVVSHGLHHKALLVGNSIVESVLFALTFVFQVLQILLVSL